MKLNPFAAPSAAAALGLLAACAACAAVEPQTAPRSASANPWTEGVAFNPMGGAEKAEAAFLIGSQAAAAPYLIRVRIAPGGSIAPHSHPDARLLTVVSGEVTYGFGATMAASEGRLYRTGESFLVPAGAPHWARAGGVEAVYQEAGVGPSGFMPVSR